MCWNLKLFSLQVGGLGKDGLDGLPGNPGMKVIQTCARSVFFFILLKSAHVN